MHSTRHGNTDRCVLLLKSRSSGRSNNKRLRSMRRKSKRVRRVRKDETLCHEKSYAAGALRGCTRTHVYTHVTEPTGYYYGNRFSDCFRQAPSPRKLLKLRPARALSSLVRSSLCLHLNRHSNLRRYFRRERLNRSGRGETRMDSSTNGRRLGFLSGTCRNLPFPLPLPSCSFRNEAQLQLQL